MKRNESPDVRNLGCRNEIHRDFLFLFLLCHLSVDRGSN
jgi:hypothetical protein